MPYDHDIFISYRRMDKMWVRWTCENFVDALRTLLRPALGNVQIFVDDQIETGASWPVALARAHARSRLLVPVLSRDYFGSEWCRLELALMHWREKHVSYRTPTTPDVLILPFIIDDGESFDPDVQVMQGERIHEFANPWIRPDSPRQEEFTEYLKRWCPRVERALQSVPPFDPTWEGLNQQQFSTMFRIKVKQQKTLPGLSLLPMRGRRPLR